MVFFDEIEKAPPDVINWLLQILDEGMPTDNVGRVVDYRNAILLLTSNVGAANIGKQSTIGFGDSGTDN